MNVRKEKQSVTILAPTGTLGYGFDPAALERGMTFSPALIGVDAGSTDPGPFYLGSGQPLVPRISVERELEILLGAALTAKIPLVVGSCGGSGSRPHLMWTADIVRALARRHGWHFRLALIEADVSPDVVVAALREGKLADFEADRLPTEDEIRESAFIVAQMGPEPIMEALDAGAEVVLAGRACDEAIMAALPMLQGFDPGLALHMGKILECGAFCAVPFGMDVMLGTLDSGGFILEPGSLYRRCTVASVVGHSLYERENPYEDRVPGGRLDMTGTRYIQLDDRRVRVVGSRFVPELPYRVKLEGSRRIGYRTISVAGIRCPTLIGRIEKILGGVRDKIREEFRREEPFTLLFHVYGRNGVMGPLEVQPHPAPHELCLVTEVVASEQDLARAICHAATGALLHYSYEGQKNNAGNLAFLYSPSEIDTGPAYVFSIYHLMQVDSPLDLFSMYVEEL
jgi:hypothetical protein